MRNDQQIFTVFGGSFVSENHSTQPSPTRRSLGPLAIVLTALIVGSASPACAVGALHRIHSEGYGFIQSSIFGTPQIQAALW